MKNLLANNGAVAASRFNRQKLFRHFILAAVLVISGLSSSSAQQTRRIPGQRPLQTAAVAGTIRDQDGRPVPGVVVEFRSRASQRKFSAIASAEGIYRLNSLPVGDYDVTVAGTGFTPPSANLSLKAAQLQVLDLQLQSSASTPAMTKGPSGLPGPEGTAAPQPEEETGLYPGLRRPEPDVTLAPIEVEVVPAESDNFSVEPDRWEVEMPKWQRYGKKGEFPYTKSHWYDPFNRNRLKGDYPMFFNFTGTSLTGFDERRLPTPSNVASERPGSRDFFGRGQQTFVDQTFRLSFDLFRGDAGFRPVDFRLHFTPAFNVNFLQTQQRGIVNADVRAGTDRFDSHVGVQEAFVEAKIHDLSPNFDFVSVRAGIQGFTSDFRGFIFSDEQPGVRIFGNLRSNRISYNLAYFYFLEKDTNSGLNTFDSRHQQVEVANVYIQDFLAKGYTTEFSFHSNFDQGDVHYDKNGFLVRPAPIGGVVALNGIPQTHNIRSYYLGWTGNGHIRRLNINHAFYQALGNDSFNSIANRPVDINAQMGALELSVDKDWLRFRVSAFWASGDQEKTVGLARKSGTARGFDSIVDDTQFAGGAFSFFDSEGIRLTGTGVALVTPFSLLPSLRSSKEEGQSNFVNPGIRVYNAGIDADVTPKLRGFLNASYLQFDRTEPLAYLLFQSPVQRGIGTDFGVGVSYRPPLTENIVLTTGVSALVPDSGLRNIYDSRVLVSAFANLRVQF
jgi:Carboxypeptidase regulatory-like domain